MAHPFLTPPQAVVRLAQTVSHHADDPDRVRAARVDLAAAKLAAAIERITASAPPLAPEHVEALHTLLDAATGGSER